MFIATSMDGYIADREGGIDWLQLVPNPEGSDMGYIDFMRNMDAVVMGRNTFETVCGFEMEWPYPIPVFVLSNTMREIPEAQSGRAQIINGTLPEILEQIHQKGCFNLYIDGGITIRHFLREDLIDELVVTIIPVILGDGSPLFSKLPHEMEFELTGSKVYLNHIVQNHYRRKRNA